MKLKTLRNLSILILLAIIASACNMPSTGGVTPTQPLIFTGQPPTPQVVPTKTQPVVQPTEIVIPGPPTPTVVPPSATPTTAPTSTPTSVIPTPTSSSCTNLVKFIDDVTIPDGTEVLPGQEFKKTWRLQNTGTCTWTNKYALVFVSGDQMSGASPMPLIGSTATDGLLDVSVTLKAPGTTGSYTGNWELRDPSGVNFGTGSNASEPFFVKVSVVEGVSELNLGTATWTDNFDNADSWYLLDTANTKFTEGDGKLVMTSITPGGGEEWDLSVKPSMDDYYLQATFITGSACSGSDRYGLLARAPSPNEGYVFEFSCDGKYRLYTWDGENYTAIQEWIASSTILAGPNQTNVMGIYMQGTNIRLYANGHKLAEFTDNTFDYGQFGLVIGSINTPNFTVYVDQAAYWDLSK